MLVSREVQFVDPVVMSRVIATSLLQDLRSSGGSHAERLSVLNLLRLLEMYSADVFYVHEPLGILEQDDFSNLNGRGASSDLSRLKAALESTPATLSPNASPPEFPNPTR